MKIPIIILESSQVVEYLQKRQLSQQYSQAKKKVLMGSGGTDFKLRKPKHLELWSFRINRQFRAVGNFHSDGAFIVSTIDNHQ